MENNELFQKINFTTEDGEDVVFCVMEQTKLNGVDYLLVTEDVEDDDEVDAYILKDSSNSEDDEAIYEMVVDDKELELIANIFGELLEDTDIIAE